jgi:peptidoglycan/xylan/chitin deacetylase (PgdA/CDA1 family)
LRSALLRLATAPLAARIISRAARDRATIFMLHRFLDPDNGVEGLHPDALRRALAHLRRERYELVSLEDLLRRIGGVGAPLKNAVAFTVDDGYADHATIAAPVFAEFDCPSTTFVTTGFLDGQLWFWWDRAHYVFRNTPLPAIALDWGSTRTVYNCTTPAAREASGHTFVQGCKVMPDREKNLLLGQLAEAAEVIVPQEAPAECAPMSWAQLRRCEQLGMTFGPHTVTHPILARTDDEQCESEIIGSWQRLRQKASAPVPIFCFPNGGSRDFGIRETNILRREGFLGAVSGEPGYVMRHMYRADPGWIYKLPRFGFPADLPHLVQYVSGLEDIKLTFRS